jgi:hypothetical protein
LLHYLDGSGSGTWPFQGRKKKKGSQKLTPVYGKKYSYMAFIKTVGA